ncbi:MAG: guanylate kinase [Bacteroidales bacterium]|jgi:guanylate kinase|nr:guanylate kinase [Bacteroidales bacterium]HOI33566.1 guanylate kinase [Bacteroidales bacterium]
MSNHADKKGKLLIFSAPSGSGKTTLVKYILEQIAGLTFSVSATSRQARSGEQDGKDYYFLSADEFRKKISEKAFLEYEEVYPDVFYGTLLDQIASKRAAGYHVVFDVDVVGGLNIKKHFGNEALSIFIKAPSIQILKERLTKRGTDNEESIKKRLEKAEWEMGFADRFDVVVVNDQLEKSQQELKKIITEFLNA